MSIHKLFSFSRSEPQKEAVKKPNSKLNAHCVLLKDVKLHPQIHIVRDEFYARFGKELINKKLGKNEWTRISHVMGMLKPGKRFLDVGTGQGHFINGVANSGLYKEVTGLDIQDYHHFFKLKDNFEVKKMSATELDYPDNHFDTVVCMEVLEHLEKADYYKALGELRRVCRGQLIMSVPYNEPLPLPSYHKGHYDTNRILKEFPDGQYTLLLKQPIVTVPWMIIEENK